jgi:hypothetical protein
MYGESTLYLNTVGLVDIFYSDYEALKKTGHSFRHLSKNSFWICRVQYCCFDFYLLSCVYALNRSCDTVVNPANRWRGPVKCFKPITISLRRALQLEAVCAVRISHELLLLWHPICLLTVRDAGLGRFRVFRVIIN